MHKRVFISLEKVAQDHLLKLRLQGDAIIKEALHELHDDSKHISQLKRAAPLLIKWDLRVIDDLPEQVDCFILEHDYFPGKDPLRWGYLC